MSRHDTTDIIRRPADHPEVLAAQAAHEERLARLTTLYEAHRDGISVALAFLRREGNARRPVDSLWPAMVPIEEALAAGGLPDSTDIREIVRREDRRARPVTIQY